VRDLGFPPEYAGFRSGSREPTLLVPAPTQLPELHDYQKGMVAEIRDLLETEVDPRGLLSLPTGAGKTRVAVQALTEAIVDGELTRPILWIAQSDELCEQGVQAWAEVWRSIGSGGDLTISRLWGDSEVEAALGGPQVVVATPDKLRNRVDHDAYDWLEDSSCVVVDEAHTAITPEYTRILEWLGISSRGRVHTRVPLIGLTATPFRGRSIDETKRLVGRFGQRRLDVGMGDKPYDELQDLDILSRVEGEVLEGISIDVDHATAAELSRFSSMKGTLREISEMKGMFREIASDVERNRRILESVLSKPNNWSILLFAVSTEHAHTMAALLSRKGVRAAAIDYETDSALRRRYVEEFRSKEIRVLCNYNVLSQGFDAPAVRAVYVTRPTFSPNAYQQMIGRGLRGPKNGGEEYCLIVNVIDNWNRFGDQLAFREFEYLWGEGH
jgi:superfamily II DNA or RNA helicase